MYVFFRSAQRPCVKQSGVEMGSLVLLSLKPVVIKLLSELEQFQKSPSWQCPQWWSHCTPLCFILKPCTLFPQLTPIIYLSVSSGTLSLIPQLPRVTSSFRNLLSTSCHGTSFLALLSSGSSLYLPCSVCHSLEREGELYLDSLLLPSR